MLYLYKPNDSNNPEPKEGDYVDFYLPNSGNPKWPKATISIDHEGIKIKRKIYVALIKKIYDNLRQPLLLLGSESALK